MRMENVHSSLAVRAEQRIGWLTLVLGLAAAAGVAVVLTMPAGAGVAVGTLLAWVNHRWLRQGLDAVVKVSVAQAGSKKPRISRWTWARLFGRYILIGVVAYAIVKFFAVPVLSVVAGLFALGAATMVEGIYEAAVRPN